MRYPEKFISELRRSILDHFDLNEVKALVFETPDIDFDDLRGDSRDTKVMDLIQKLNNRDRLDELIQLIKKKRPEGDFSNLDNWLSGQGSTNTSRRNNKRIAHLLPYLVNRRHQDAQLLEIIEEIDGSSKQPVICILPGDENQGQDKYIERLQFESLPLFLELNERDSVSAISLEWPDFVSEKESLQRQLQINLSKKVMESPKKSKTDINTLFHQFNGPVIVYTHIYTKDWSRLTNDTISGYLEFWHNWPDLQAGQDLFVCLFIQYKLVEDGGFKHMFQNHKIKKLNNDIKNALSELPSSSTDSLPYHIFPQMASVSIEDAQRWANDKKDSIKGFKGIIFVKEKIEKIYKDYKSQKNADEIPLDILSRKLYKFLNDLET